MNHSQVKSRYNYFMSADYSSEEWSNQFNELIKLANNEKQYIALSSIMHLWKDDVEKSKKLLHS
jgi:hypothetical protein